jgi:hypothetical protein
MRCSWAGGGAYGCSTTARYYVVYGCVEQHIRERALCPPHYNMWKDLMGTKAIVCQIGCDYRMIEYLMCRTNMITEFAVGETE